MRITLRSGRILKYNKDKTTILKLYQPDIYEHLSFLEKIKIILGDVLHINFADKHLLEIFDKITTYDEISETIREVAIYYPSELLHNGIVIVDNSWNRFFDLCA